MSDRDEALKAHTHKDQGLSVRDRVFYVLGDDKPAQSERNSKMLAKLTEALIESGTITEDHLDEILLQVVGR